jgi:heat-inducible transcriptional repressor
MQGTGGSRIGGHRGGDLSERQRRVLALAVREYIEHGEPVPSGWLAEQSGMGVSSATVRNILAQLTELGYLHQPHTSAGRIPTDLGYRSYVDVLLQSRRPARPAAEIEARLRQAATPADALDEVSQELSRTSHHVAFALSPADWQTTLKHIEFVTMGAQRVLVVVVAGNGQVWHKAVHTDEPMSPSGLNQAAIYLNSEFAGRQLGDIRSAIVGRLQEDRALYDTLMARALTLASASLEGVGSEARLFVHGASTLLEDSGAEAEAIPLDRLRAVIGMIEEKHRLVHLLSEYIDGPGVTVVIGAEHPVTDLRDFSLVAATSGLAGASTTIGVIGPRRMRYSRAIAAVDGVSQAVERTLFEHEE